MDFDDLPDSWEVVIMSDILQELLTGSRPKGGVQDFTEGIPSLGGEHLNYSGGFKFEKVKYVPVDFAKKLDKVKLVQNDILIVKDGATTGKTSFIDKNFPFDYAVINEHLFLCRIYSKVISKYVFYFLYSRIGNYQILLNFRGAAQGGITKNFANNVRIPLPPLNEQKRIVEKIELIEERTKIVKRELENIKVLLKKLRRSLLASAFRGDLTKDWRANHPDIESAEVLLERIKQERRSKWEQAELEKMRAKGITPKDDKWKSKYSEPQPVKNIDDLPNIPDGWCWGTLDTITLLKSGIAKNKNSVFQDAVKIPYLRVANVQRGYLDLEEIKEIEVSQEIIDELILQPNDILFTEGGDRDKLGRGWIWQGEIEKCIHQNHVFRGRLYIKDMSPKFISWYSNSYGASYFLREGKQTTNLASINLSKLSAFPLPLPPLEEQKEIVRKLEKMMKFADQVEERVKEAEEKLNKFNQSVLAKAFRGKLVPQDSNDEPASVLLGKIQQEKNKTTIKKTKK